jgi:hypothetical protein
LIDELCTCFEGKVFRENEGVVTVEEEVFDLVESVKTFRALMWDHTGAMVAAVSEIDRFGEERVV